MKFKSPTETPIHICLLSGHSAVIGNEWRELPPILHRKALEEGCISDNMDAESIAVRVEAAKPEQSNNEILVGIIKGMMANPQPSDFTAADLPNLKRLSGVAGWTVTREEMMQAVHAIGAEDDAE